MVRPSPIGTLLLCHFPLGSTLSFSFGRNPRASRGCDSWIRFPVEVGKYDHSEQLVPWTEALLIGATKTTLVCLA